MSFTHLQVRSGYSLYESTITVDKLVEKASELQFEALALTDENVLYGTIPFYKACLKHGIKPIIGLTTTVLFEDQTKENCVLLAKTNNGYQQLINISTIIKKNNKTEIELLELKKFTTDLICVLPVKSSKLASLLSEVSHENAKVYINQWHDLFGQEDFYLGIQSHGLETEQVLHNSIKVFHETYEIPVVPINDVRYINEQDDNAYGCLQAIKKKEQWPLADSHTTLKQHHLRSSQEMNQLFDSFWPGLLQVTESITRKCNVFFDFDSQFMPSFPIEEQIDAHTYLERVCWKKVEQRFEQITSEISTRLKYELEVIHSMKFSDYFLIVWDIIVYAKNKNIVVGPGRGSAAGSMVAYVLGITDVDPIKYELLFERFLNPERITMPDIDIDFSDYRRDEVIDYVRSKYGEEHVAQIITFGTYGARSLLRDLIKTFGIDQQDAAFILRKFPAHVNKSIQDQIQDSEELKQYINQSKKLRTLFTIAIKLEGLPRHISTHAAGVVISEKPLTDYVPLTVGANEMNLTQYPMNDLEAIGILKIDFLGLRNLTFIEQILKSIPSLMNKEITVANFPENDEKTYKLLQKGKTSGIFQLESDGMKQVLTKLQPTSFEDIVAVNALYRPGPMDNIPTFIKGKHNQASISYLHEDLAPILGKTYGVLIYQEQIMEIAHKMAGYSYGEADIFRRAISKKEEKTIAEQKDVFIQGCLDNGYEKSIGEQLFLWILKFSNYGFNRSHAVAYSKISYQLAYLKAHFPARFFAELLSSATNQQKKIYDYIQEAKSLGIKISQPSINKSFGRYTVENNSVRIGLLSVKGVGHQVVKEIIQARKKGPFTSLFDFCLRVSLKIVNRVAMELLIIAGAFDETYPNRASLLSSIDQAIDQGELFREFNDQPSLLQNKIELRETYTEIDDFSQMKKLSDEKELLGFYVSSHPLKKSRESLIASGYVSIDDTQNLIGKRNVKSAGIIHSIKTIRTKRGDPMAFIIIGDETSDTEAVVFPDLYRNVNRWMKEETIILLEGNVEERNDRFQWLLSDIKPFSEEDFLINTKRLFVKISEEDSEKALSVIRKIALNNPGNVPIIIYHEKKEKTYKLTKAFNIEPSQDCLQELMNYFGKQSVVLDK